MTILPAVYAVKPTLVLDFMPALSLLAAFEALVQAHQSYEVLASHLADRHSWGEPVARGADPVSNALNDALPSASTHVEIRQERLHLFWVKNKSPLPVNSTDLIDHYPGIVGFMYCIEDLRFLELSPPQ
jgi:hypothetical protein